MVRELTQDEAAAAVGAASSPTDAPRTVICQIDRPETASAVASVGSQIADRLDLRLVLAHVVRKQRARHSRTRRSIGRGHGEPAERARELLDSIDCAGGVERRVLDGEPARALRALADEEDGACLVVGSRARSALAARLVGRASRALACAANRPVVVVPSGALTPDGHGCEGGTRAVVCGADLSEQGDTAAAVAGAIAVQADLDLVLAYVDGPPFARRRGVRAWLSGPAEDGGDEFERETPAAHRLIARADYLERRGAHAKVRLEVGSAAHGVDHAARAEDALLIVVGLRRPRGLRSVFLEPTCAHLAAAASRPVMIVPPGALFRLAGEAADTVARRMRQEAA